MSNILSKVSRRNIEVHGKVQFSARIDFLAEGGLIIAEINDINNIEAKTFDEESYSYIENQLKCLLCRMHPAK